MLWIFCPLILLCQRLEQQIPSYVSDDVIIPNVEDVTAGRQCWWTLCTRTRSPNLIFARTGSRTGDLSDGAANPIDLHAYTKWVTHNTNLNCAHSCYTHSHKLKLKHINIPSNAYAQRITNTFLRGKFIVESLELEIVLRLGADDEYGIIWCFWGLLLTGGCSHLSRLMLLLHMIRLRSTGHTKISRFICITILHMVISCNGLPRYRSAAADQRRDSGIDSWDRGCDVQGSASTLML